MEPYTPTGLPDQQFRVADPLRPFAEGQAPGVDTPPEEEPSPWQQLQTGWDQHTRPHLEELRWRIWVCLLSVAVSGSIGWWLAPPAINRLKLLAPPSTVFIQIAPGEAFMAVLKVALAIGILLALPVVLVQVVGFLMPGLSGRERRWLIVLVLGGTGLFGVGMGLAGWILLPTALAWLLAFGEGLVVPQISIATYLDTCLTLLVLTGLLCELPLLLLAAMGLGWVKSSQLLGRWRELIVGVLVVSAIITPTWDPLTLCLISLPLIALLGLTLVIARFLRW